MGTHPIFESDFDCLTDMLRLAFLFVSGLRAESCASTDLIEPWCKVANGTLKIDDKKAECVKDKIVIGVSYAHCNLDAVPATDLTQNITWIDFRQSTCPYSKEKTSIGDLYATIKLETLYVSKSCNFCPGSFQVNNYTLSKNETFQPWGAADFQSNDYGVCTEPVSFCSFNNSEPFNGYYCPENSMCVDKGVGTFDCQCNDGYHGYRCTETGKFPFATVLSVTPLVTLSLTGVLWFYGRRHVKKD